MSAIMMMALPVLTISVMLIKVKMATRARMTMIRVEMTLMI